MVADYAAAGGILNEALAYETATLNRPKVIKAINENSTKEELAGIAAQIKQFEAMFTLFAEVKTGDNLVFDWIPGVGTVTTMNGKKIGDTVADVAFYNAFLKIWIGNAPADSSLKPRLLGAAN